MDRFLQERRFVGYSFRCEKGTSQRMDVSQLFVALRLMGTQIAAAEAASISVNDNRAVK